MKGAPGKVLVAFEKLKSESDGCLELKMVSDGFYVYGSTSVWNKRKKRPDKKTWYIGKISREGVFSARKPRTGYQVMDREIFEYGNCMLAYSLLEDLVPLLERFIPFYREVFACAVLKVVSPGPVRLLKSKWERLALGRIWDADLRGSRMTGVFYDVGMKPSSWYKVYSGLIEDDDLLLYDMTSIISYSENVNLAAKGYNADDEYRDQINIVMAFSTGKGVPVGLDVFNGSLKDISTIKDFIERLGGRACKIGFIFDRGFYSTQLFKNLRSLEASYIVPLKKNSLLFAPEDVVWTHTFEYRDRCVRTGKKTSDLGVVYYYEDPLLQGEQIGALLKKVHSKLMTMAEYEQKKRQAGIVALLSNLDRENQWIYDQYKGREDVEQAFDAMKNTLESDKTYMQTPEGVRGYMFITFLALRAYFKVLKRLRQLKLANKYSVEEVFYELSKIDLIQDKNNEYLAQIPKKTNEILALFNDIIPMG